MGTDDLSLTSSPLTSWQALQAGAPTWGAFAIPVPFLPVLMTYFSSRYFLISQLNGLTVPWFNASLCCDLFPLVQSKKNSTKRDLLTLHKQGNMH